MLAEVCSKAKEIARLKRAVLVRTVCLTGVWSIAPMGVAEAAKRFDFLIEPTYSICLAGPTCSSLGRTTLTVKYKPIITKTQLLRVELSRAYLQSSEETDGDSIDVVEGRSYQAATDLLAVKLGTYADGFERTNLQVGYSYQHSIGGSPAYHAGYGSYNFYFGRQIKRGGAGPAHQFDVLLKGSRNVYQSSTLLPQSFFQVTPSVTFPLDPDGTTRVLVSYSAQQRFAGSGRLSPFSSSALARLTHNFTPSIRAWIRIDWRLLTAPLVQQTTTVGLGAEFTL